MPSNATIVAATVGGLNIRTESSTRDIRFASSGDPGEWPELLGLEVGRQVSVIVERHSEELAYVRFLRED